MSKEKTRAIAHSRYYKNETKKGTRTATKAQQGIKYYGYGVGDDKVEKARGHWYSSEGVTTHNDVRGWAAEQALENKYTYTLVLSLKDGQMKSTDFVEAMGQEKVKNVFGSNWRLITHYDSGHVHAHVIAFRDKTIQKKDFTAWTNDIKDYLTEREIDQIRESALELKKQNDRAQGIAQSRSRSRDRDLDNGL